ncbi:hypothetical protein WA158_005039 [Blastocystis sp. Blastoise]
MNYVLVFILILYSGFLFRGFFVAEPISSQKVRIMACSNNSNFQNPRLRETQMETISLNTIIQDNKTTEEKCYDHYNKRLDNLKSIDMNKIQDISSEAFREHFLPEDFDMSTQHDRIVLFKIQNYGFGNKMLCLSNALFLATMVHRNLTICGWPAARKYFKFHSSIRIIKTCPKIEKSSVFTDYTELLTNNTKLLATKLEEPFLYIDTCRPILEPILNHNSFSSSFHLFDHHHVSKYNQKDNYRRYVFTNLIIPSKSLIRKLCPIKHQYEYDNLMGLQIRTGDQSDFNTFDNTTFLVGNTYKELLRRVIIINDGIIYPLKWFVVSDSSSMKKTMKEKLGDLMLSYDSVIVHSGTSSLTEVNDGNYDALIELYLLGLCKFIIATPRSTFGVFAKVLNEYWTDITILNKT